MTLIISDENGRREIKNTKGTKAMFNQGGQINFGAEFDNSGEVEIDLRANVSFLEKVTNSGSFNIKDYITESKYQLIEKVIDELEGEQKELLSKVYSSVKENNDKTANSWFKKLVESLKDPSMISSTTMRGIINYLAEILKNN